MTTEIRSVTSKPEAFQILDAVYQFACQSFLAEFRSDFHVQGDGQGTLRGHEPARHIFRGNLAVARVEHHISAREREGVGLARCFGPLDGRDRRLVERGECRRNLFHTRTVNLAESLEIGLDAQGHEARGVGHEFHFLDIHFSQYQVPDR